MSETTLIKKLNNVVEAIGAELNNIGTFASDGVITGTYSQESLADFRKDFDSNTASLRAILADTFKSSGLDAEFDDGMSLEAEAPMKAALIAALASTNPVRYHQQAMKGTSNKNALSLESIYSGIGGDLDVTEAGAYSQEAYEERALSNYNVQNIVFNALASRQDPFAEAFFPTKTVAMSEGGLSVTVDRQEVIDYKVHPSTGALVELNRRALIDAYADPSVLSRQGTELVPHAAVDGSADAMFVDEALVATRTVQVNGVSVPTRPLAFGKKVNLLGISQHPGLLDGGTIDITDQIAPGMKLKTIDVLVTDGTVNEVFRIRTEDMFRSQFRKSHEGRGREVELNFNTGSLVFDATTTTIAGAPSALLAGVINTPDLVVRLAVSVSGNGDLNQGYVELNASSLRVEEVRDADGEVLSLDAGQGAAVVAAVANLKFTPIGYDLRARRSNSNWRTTGAIIDVTPYTESYAIELGYPITVMSPTDEADHNSTGAKLAGMVNAARIRNSNNAVGALFNYAEQLENYKEAMKRGIKLELLGAGRHIVTPYFHSDAIDVAAALVNRRSGERADDAAEVLVNNIRDAAWNMYRDANYGPALDMANGGAATKPKLLIGVDSVTKRYLDRRADPRLLGSEMDYEIVDTNDSRMEGKIVLTFTTGRPGSDNGLGFGTHAYVVELIQRVQRTMNGATSTQDRVVPRSIHVPVLPVMTVFDVVNLGDALTNS